MANSKVGIRQQGLRPPNKSRARLPCPDSSIRPSDFSCCSPLFSSTGSNELTNSGRRTEAIAHFEAALQVRPDWAEVHNDLGTLLANTPGRSADALAHFASAVRINPNLAQAQRNLGLILLSVPGRGPEALAHLEAAQRLQAPHAVAARP